MSLAFTGTSLASRRSRALLAATALATVAAAATLGATAAPARSADPAGDCATAFPVADLTADDAVHGLTVTHGTDPDPFTGTVLGVLQDGIATGVDMVMVRLTSPEIDDIGVWEGMSGSPVYASDGRLIGAVAYGLASGPSSVAGVTPFEDMDDLLTDLGGRVAVGRSTAHRIASASDVTVREARKGFEELPAPIGVAGVGATALARAEKHRSQHSWLPRSTYAAGRASSDDTSAADIVAGGNLAVSLSYGDVTLAGVGTVTSVCGDEVVGFGHPLDWKGETSLGLHPADAIYIQDDMYAGFKVSNIGDPVGTITRDKRAGVAGMLGALPDTTDLSVGLTHGADSRTGVTHIADRDAPNTLAWSTYYGLVADHEALVDSAVKGTEDLSWTITGTDREGQPFSLSSGNRYAAATYLSDRIGYAIGDIVYGLAKLPGVQLDTITTDSSLADKVRNYSVTKVEVRTGGQWQRVTTSKGFVVRSGGVLRARVTVGNAATTTVVPAHLTVPAKYAGQMLMLAAVGGKQVGSGRMPSDVHDVQGWLDDQVRNDQVLLALVREGRAHSDRATSAASMRVARSSRMVSTVLGPVDGVVKGHVYSFGLAR